MRNSPPIPEPWTGWATKPLPPPSAPRRTGGTPAAVARRAARGVGERCVSLRPAPDTMTYLTALLPAAQGVAAYAALVRDAGTARAAGDDRTRGQAMADTLVERVTGTPGGISGAQIQLVMTDHTLLHADTEPARLPGYGTVPAEQARNIALTAPNDNDLNLWVRRLYTTPGTGELVAMNSTARLFPAALKRFLQIRDNTCRTPYCDAPIRHHDHVTAWHHRGPTTTGNGQGLCEACNHTKETPGWTAQTIPGPRHTVATTTPTGHTYHSTAPPLPGTPPLAWDRDRNNTSRKDSRQLRRTPLRGRPIGGSARPPEGPPRPTVQVLGRIIQSGMT